MWEGQFLHWAMTISCVPRPFFFPIASSVLTECKIYASFFALALHLLLSISLSLRPLILSHRECISLFISLLLYLCLSLIFSLYLFSPLSLSLSPLSPSCYVFHFISHPHPVSCQGYQDIQSDKSRSTVKEATWRRRLFWKNSLHHSSPFALSNVLLYWVKQIRNEKEVNWEPLQKHRVVSNKRSWKELGKIKRWIVYEYWQKNWHFSGRGLL